MARLSNYELSYFQWIGYTHIFDLDSLVGESVKSKVDGLLWWKKTVHSKLHGLVLNRTVICIKVNGHGTWRIAESEPQFGSNLLVISQSGRSVSINVKDRFSTVLSRFKRPLRSPSLDCPPSGRFTFGDWRLNLCDGDNFMFVADKLRGYVTNAFRLQHPSWYYLSELVISVFNISIKIC